MSYFCLSQNGVPHGYFVLSRVEGQARLADLRIRTDKPDDWIAAYAYSCGARRPGIHKVANWLPMQQSLLRVRHWKRNGFRMRGEMPVLALDRKNLLGDAGYLHLGMLDDDSGYLNNPANPYCT